MKHEKFNLTEDGRVNLTSYIIEQSPEMPHMATKPAVLVFPGGGYEMTSDREAEIVALIFAAAGFNAFVLRYSVKEYAYFPYPQADASAALKFIRERADYFCTDPNKIAVCGFSAGGHLAASLGTIWNNPEVQAAAGCTGEENKPNAMILIYPVISATQHMYQGCRDRQLAKVADNPEEYERLRKLISCELQVGRHTPPAFIAHTFADNAVPVENSLMFASALAEYDIPFDLHIFKNGCHGLALSNNITFVHQYTVEPEFAVWTEMCTKWLWELFGNQLPEDVKLTHLPLENRVK